MWICSIAIVNKCMALNQDGMHFVICTKQGNKIERVDLAKQGQGFKPSMAHLYTQILVKYLLPWDLHTLYSPHIK